jgi:hypothetical protein
MVSHTGHLTTVSVSYCKLPSSACFKACTRSPSQGGDGHMISRTGHLAKVTVNKCEFPSCVCFKACTRAAAGPLTEAQEQRMLTASKCGTGLDPPVAVALSHVAKTGDRLDWVMCTRLFISILDSDFCGARAGVRTNTACESFAVPCQVNFEKYSITAMVCLDLQRRG